MTHLLLLIALPPITAPSGAVMLGVFGLCLLGVVYFGVGLLRGKK